MECEFIIMPTNEHSTRGWYPAPLHARLLPVEEKRNATVQMFTEIHGFR